MSSGHTALSQLKGIPTLNISAINQASRHDYSESSKPSDAQASLSPSSGPESAQRALERSRSILSAVYNNQVFVSGEVIARDLALMNANEITHVLNSAGDECLNFFPQQFQYLTLVLQDHRLLSASLESVLFDSISFIAAAIDGGGRVLVHCREGVSRSCTHVIAFLMWRENWSFRRALDHVKERRPCCAPNTGFTVSLIKFGQLLESVRDAWRATPSEYRGDRARLYRVALHHSKAPFTVVVEVNSQEEHADSWRTKAICLDPRFFYILRSSRRRFYIWEGIELLAQIRPVSSSAVSRFLHNVRRFECRPNEQLEVMYTRQTEEPREFTALLQYPIVAKLDALNSEAGVMASGAAFTWDSWLAQLRSSKYQFNPNKIASPRPQMSCH